MFFSLYQKKFDPTILNGLKAYRYSILFHFLLLHESLSS